MSQLIRANEYTKTPLPGLQSLNHCRVDDGTPLLNARRGGGDRLKPAAVQSYGASSTSSLCDIYADNKTVPLTLSRIPRFLLHLELPVQSFKQPTLGGNNRYPGEAPETLPQIRALQQPSTPMDNERLSLCIRKLQTEKVAPSPPRDPTTLRWGK